ncbi:uncharacterized protein LOC131650480 [Vicia villosa]|uniref:uncharacterized protein LOC131650480 n=1 Tax=Vicia villosa TaxID=3911 RepID=UPI00273B92B4|nr:uncharacterized protein LOC131650480 [Vicia villosa]
MKRSSSVSSDEDNSELKINKISVEDLKHKCNICGKAYNNGKALGGHRRSHFLKKKANHHSQKVKTPLSIQVSNNRANRFNDNDKHDEEEIDEKKKLSCYICKKEFSTNNALYGHMRSHPDRVVKGVSPPSSNNSNSSIRQNKEDEDDQGDDNCSLPRWQKRDKRGRKCIGSAEAADNLLYLRSDKYLSILSTDELVPHHKRDFHISSDESKTHKLSDLHHKEDIHMSSNESQTPELSVAHHKGEFHKGESSSNEIQKKKLGMKKIKIFIGSSSKIRNKNNKNDDEGDDEKLKKDKSLSQSHVKEEEMNHNDEQKILDFDLNEPYVMEDQENC